MLSLAKEVQIRNIVLCTNLVFLILSIGQLHVRLRSDGGASAMKWKNCYNLLLKLC